MTYPLRISTDIRDWLAELRDSDPVAARAVGAAILAVGDAGAALGRPLVVPVAEALHPPDPGPDLDSAYQRQLGLLQQAHRGTARVATSRKRLELQVSQLQQSAAKLQAQVSDAVSAGRDDLAREARARLAAAEGHLAEQHAQLRSLTEEEEKLVTASRRLHARVDEFRTRKEAVQARYTAAEAMRAVYEAFLVTTDKLRDLLATTRDDDPAAAAAAIRGLLEDARQAERDLRAAESAAARAADTAAGADAAAGAAGQAAAGQAASSATARPGMLELRPAAPGDRRCRILFQVADGAVVLLAQVPDDGDDRAVLQAIGSLRRAHALLRYDVESFVDEFFPGQADEVEADAEALVARSRARTLAAARQRAGLTQAQVAARMQVRQERVSAIERAEPGATEVRTLAAYVRALGGCLEIVAHVDGERIPLSSGTP
jgi:phage shock protein A/DNA-binding XRE family transcriptional regulator